MRTSLAIALLLASAAASAQQLGTLFHSPKEREALERLRRGESPGQPAFMNLPDPVITGYVKRSDGKSTVFLDKQPYPAWDGRMQRLLEPRIIERYEPIPLPPAPTPAPPAEEDEPNAAAKAVPPKKNPATPSKGEKED